jgi:hypothetical protein
MPQSPVEPKVQLTRLACKDPRRKCPRRSREPGCRRKAQPDAALVKDLMNAKGRKEPVKQGSPATLERGTAHRGWYVAVYIACSYIGGGVYRTLSPRALNPPASPGVYSSCTQPWDRAPRGSLSEASRIQRITD